MDNPRRPARADLAIRVSAAATVVGIGAIAAVISYRHALAQVRAHGETGVTAYLTPLTIDGLVFVASLVMLDSARRRMPSPALARLALALGIGATVAVNVLHGLAHGPVGAVIAAWPAVTLVVVVELLMTMIRRARPAAEPVPAPAPVPAVRPASVPRPRPPADDAPVPAAAPAESVEPAVAKARDRFADLLAAGELPTLTAIRRELKVGHPRAVRIRAALESAR
ncbi:MULTISPECIES: DUF2637 domain-containing protein [Thermomonospora]|uniref:DUF2637 domain-containing protein n=1 Tax=Thermomonospora cellulosilytica TaxID=1411118 RepID=A0A7W3MV99_9ACTN|nr:MULTISPECIES: DUF2637 domain-containing protein [Thermomonospora]MBA9002493.1 hypothetical protein [Thermomonospora cellulosilytica]